MRPSIAPITLATGYPVTRVEGLLDTDDRKEISRFLTVRFQERYVTPVGAVTTNPFIKAAVACLLLETLQAFRAGVGRTPDRQSAIFFRASLEAHDGFEELAFYENSSAEELTRARARLKAENKRRKKAGLGPLKVRPRDDTLYGNIRSAIVHQGETTGGWRLTRRIPAFDWDERMLNIHWFHSEAAAALDVYTTAIASENVEPDLWTNCKKKLRFTVNHSKRASERAGDET